MKSTEALNARPMPLNTVADIHNIVAAALNTRNFYLAEEALLVVDGWLIDPIEKQALQNMLTNVCEAIEDLQMYHGDDDEE